MTSVDLTSLQSCQAVAATSAVTPLFRLFERLGVRTTRQALAEACGNDFTMHAMASRLRERGMAARVVHLSGARDLACLGTPTLVETKNGAPALLVRVSRTRAWLELATGVPQSFRIHALDDLIGDTAIDRAPPMSSSAGDRRRNGSGSRSTAFAIASVIRQSPSLRRALSHVVFVSIAINLFGLAGPIVSRVAIDDALPEGARSTLALVVAATLIVAAQRAWAGWLRERSARFVDARLQAAAVRGIFGHTLDLPFGVLQRRSVADTCQTLASAESLAKLVASDLLVPLLDAVSSVGYFVLLLVTLPGVALASLGVGAVIAAQSALFGRTLARLDEEVVRTSEAQRHESLELLAGAASIKAAAGERTRVAQWLGALVDEETAAYEKRIRQASFERVVETMYTAYLAIVLVWGAESCLHAGLSVGALLASMQATVGFLGGVQRLSAIAVKAWGSRVHLRRVDDVLAEHAETEAGTTSATAASEVARRSAMNGEDAIAVDAVWYRHDRNAPWIFEGYDLRVPHGTSLSLTWPSGRGKTTLLRLIAGLYVPEHGQITICGLEPRAARHLVAYVPQVSHLFSGSILENLRILSGGAGVPRLLAAAEATGLTGVVGGWPMKLETRIAPGGANVSGGQRQMIVLTAAIASERPILLLDEALAHVDRLTQARLSASHLFEGRTVVTAAHDLARPA